MLINKKLLIILNTFGSSPNRHISYMSSLDIIFEHILKNNLENEVRVVVSSVLNDDDCIKNLKNKYGNTLKIFRYNEHLPVQVTCNKTILSSIDEFNEEYNGYLYVSAGVFFPDVNTEKGVNFLPTLISKNETNEYGIIHIQVNTDCGYYGLGNNQNFNLNEDYDISIGNFIHFHIALLHKDLKEFYGKPITDIHGSCGMEVGLSYIPYALRKKYIILGNYVCVHTPSSDGPHNSNNASREVVPCGLNWGRTPSNFLQDTEGIESGLGYYEGSHVGVFDPNRPFILVSDKTKYDLNNFSNDERLKFSIKRQYFTNESEIDYNKIKYELI